MVSETQNQAIEAMLESIIAGEPDYFLVGIKIKPTNNIKVFLDGDNGITIEKCVQVNRALYKKIEAANLFPDGDFSLEVSSPGVDEPIKTFRQYKKNIGRNIEAILNDGNKKEGKLAAVSEDGIIIEETRGKNKRKEIISHSFLFNDIKSTKIQTVF
jgi:ribosome maturation factor RimP